MSEIRGVIMHRDTFGALGADTVLARDAKVSIPFGIPVYTDDRVPVGVVVASSWDGTALAVNMRLDDPKTMSDFVDIQTRWRNDMRASFTFRRTIEISDPSRRRVRSLRELWRQVRDILAYEYAKARDGRPPRRETLMPDMRITSVTC